MTGSIVLDVVLSRACFGRRGGVCLRMRSTVVFGDSCSLFYLLFELTYCCLGVGVDGNRVRGRRGDEDVAVVVC